MIEPQESILCAGVYYAVVAETSLVLAWVYSPVALYYV
jgi:hypothetical protein